MHRSIVLLLLAPLLLASTLERGTTHLKRHQWRMAASAFKDVIDREPNNHEAVVGLGRALAGMGQCKRALWRLGQARPTPAWNADAALAEADCWHQRGDDSQADAAWEEAQILAPGRRLMTYRMAVAGVRTGDEAQYNAALDRLQGPDDNDLMVAMARTWRALEWGEADFEQSLRELEKDMQSVRSRGGRAQLFIIQGTAWLDAGENKLAEDTLRKGSQILLNHPGLNALIAEAVRRRGYTNNSKLVLDRRVVSVMDGVLFDAIEVRILVDLGKFDQARALANTLPDSYDPDILASRWYLAQATGDEPAAADLAAEYQSRVWAVGRTLDRLHPMSEKP